MPNLNTILNSTNFSAAVWTPRESSRNWSALASSRAGNKLIAAVNGGQIYTSTDSGVTWTPQETNRNWKSVASSADGTRLVAVEYGYPTPIYISTNSGVTWSPSGLSTVAWWTSVASSADNTKLAAASDRFNPGDYLYTSTDAGVTWTAHLTDARRDWGEIASSADGSNLVALDRGFGAGGQIYTSTDGGVNWVARESNRNWAAVVSSSDGSRLAAAVSGGQIYTSISFPGFGEDYQSNRRLLELAFPGVITHGQSLVGAETLSSPRVVSRTVDVGQRLNAPAFEPGAAGGAGYLAGYIHQPAGVSFNINAYVNPFVAGLETANRGSIVPVNAIPGTNHLEVWWFRTNRADITKGFRPAYWPSVIGRYTIQWPSSPREIVLASNKGSEGEGPLNSFDAGGTIYSQNTPGLPGYNPNEEHALVSGGIVFATRDDLNITSGAGYSSHSFALLQYVDQSGRPAMSVFKVLREKPESGWVFDYIVEAGRVAPAADASAPPGQADRGHRRQCHQLQHRTDRSGRRSARRLAGVARCHRCMRPLQGIHLPRSQERLLGVSRPAFGSADAARGNLQSRHQDVRCADHGNRHRGTAVQIRGPCFAPG